VGEHRVEATVNGRSVSEMVEPRLTLADFLRDRLRLTGTHLGCEHGVCGACTVLVDGAAIRSCLAFAVQMQGCAVTTVEGLTPSDGAPSDGARSDGAASDGAASDGAASDGAASDGAGLSELQAAFRAEHGLQCGFCTPGFIVSATALLASHPDPTVDQIREGLSGNLCRCTGYQGIVRGVQAAARARHAGREAGGGREAGAGREAEGE
jgi:aerobic carbon-monoxide dehydrogenase small subunit